MNYYSQQLISCIENVVLLSITGIVMSVPKVLLQTLPKPILVETENGLQVSIPEERASATLSWLEPEFLFPGTSLEPGKWLWFNRIINQSGKPYLGTILLDAVLSHCKKNRYSILNEVSAYGALSQKDLENWYISKGFRPLDYKKYGNKLLIWRPE